MPGRSSPRRRCRCSPGDTAETLADRILTAEHKLYPLALRLVASGEAVLEGGRVLLQGGG